MTSIFRRVAASFITVEKLYPGQKADKATTFIEVNVPLSDDSMILTFNSTRPFADLDYSTDRSSSPESDEMKWNHNVAKKRQISQPYKFGEHITIWIENISLQQDFQMQNMVM